MVVARWRCFQLREYHRSLISLSLEVKVDVCENHYTLHADLLWSYESRTPPSLFLFATLHRVSAPSPRYKYYM